MSTNYMQELFNPSVSPQTDLNESQKNSNFFRPNATSTQDKKYTAIIRFLPWVDDPSNSILKKETAWLKNDVTGESRSVDSPATVGERCPIKEMFFTLWKSNHEADKAIAKKKFSVRTNYFSLVQVIEDKVNPENAGKILIWKYGMKIQEKIAQEMNNEFNPRNPFSVLDGRYFHVNVKEVSGYNNYDACMFIDIPALPAELQFYDANGNVIGKADPNDQQSLVNYLKSGPSLSEVQYKPWDDNTRAFVDGVIRAFNDPINYAKTIQGMPGTPQYVQQHAQPIPANATFEQAVMEPMPSQHSQQSPQQKSVQTDFLNGLTNNIAEANNTNTGKQKGSESVDGLNFDDILNNQIF